MYSKFDFNEIVTVISDKPKYASIRGKRGIIKGKSGTDEDEDYIVGYGVSILDANDNFEMCWFLLEEDLQSTGQNADPKLFDAGMTIRVSVDSKGAGHFKEVVRKLKYHHFEIVKIISPEVRHSNIKGKNAVVISKAMVEDFPQLYQYGLYILDKKDNMEFYVTANENELAPTSRKLPYSFEPRPEKFNKNDIKNLIILPESKSSLKLTDKIRFAVRKVLSEYDFIHAFNQYYNFLVYVKKEIRAGETLLSAHGPAFKYESHDMEKFETPFALPRENSSTPCPQNLVQVEIVFTIKINNGKDKQDFKFRAYFLSLLVNIDNATIWDARGILATDDD